MELEAADDPGAMETLEAETVYILMRKEYRVSRSVRAQWFLDHLNSTINVEPYKPLEEYKEDLNIISVIPNEPPLNWNVETSHFYKYLVTSHTSLIFLGHKYRIVYCLDMSPSLSAVDIQHGEIMIDEIFLSLKTSLYGLTRPFVIPGSLVFFQPQIYVTVIAHTPFFTTPAQQVLVQGWQVTPQNLNEFLNTVKIQLERLEDTVAEVAGVVHEQLEALRAESEKLVGGLFEENVEMIQSPSAHVPMVSPDSGFINMLRYGMLALRLLPECSCANLIILTDGIVGIPDVHVFDSILTQLRTNTVACSILHVGSLFHPQCCKGMVPHADLLHFIASATFGTYLTTIPEITSVSENQMNMYHRAFLSWNFSKHTSELDLDFNFPRRPGEWRVSNSCFYGIHEPLYQKKQAEETASISLSQLLCCRLREGYTIRHLTVNDDQIEINMVLPWKNHIHIEYTIKSELPINQNPSSGVVHYSICIEAPYEFLHDITCLLKKPFKSPYRHAVVSRFWAALKNLSHTDQLLVHLNSFHSNPASYTVPEGIRSGMPVFYLPPNSNAPVLSSSDMPSSQFAQFWLPVCTLEPAIWQKWLHTERIGLILLHDHPLPKHLHLPNTSGRFQVVQCRQAAAALNSLLKDWSTFVLIENQTYVKLIYSEPDKPPMSFYIIRVTSKLPCVVINVAFLGGTSAFLRYKVVQELKKHIASLRLPQRPSNKESLPRKVPLAKQPLASQQSDGDNGHSPVARTWSDISCCILLQKPLEKILIRYERMPSDFGTVVFPDGTQPICINKHYVSGHGVTGFHSSPGSSLLTTLSRYLHHRRWIWAAQENSDTSLGIAAVARILSTITKMRIQEGFNFAHSTAGIINMVLEVQMKGISNTSSETNETVDEESGVFPCVIQYVLFPPHATSTSARESCSDEEEEDDDDNDNNTAASEDQNNDQETDGALQIITECWIEPQHGTVINSPPERYFMEGLPYYKLADVICDIDAECISSLLTFEHLSLMCRNTNAASYVKVPDTPKDLGEESKQDGKSAIPSSRSSYFATEERIQFIPFAFNLMKIFPKCQQAEQLFSMYVQDLGAVPPRENSFPLLTQADMPNKLLYDMLYEHTKKLNNKELHLSAEDSQRFLHLLLNRKRENTVSLPIPKSSTQSETGQNEDILPAESSSTEGKVSDKISANLKPLPKWRCFLKGISTTHVMVTFIPASFIDLKLLMLTKESLSGGLPSTVKFVAANYSHGSENPEFSEHLESCNEPKNQSEYEKEFNIDQVGQSVEGVALSSLIDNRSSCLPPTSSASVLHLTRSSSCDTKEMISQISPAILHSDADSPLFQRDFYFEPFRMRASSWDTIKRPGFVDTNEQVLDRIRAGSMDSKTRRTRPFVYSSVQLKSAESDTLLKLKRESGGRRGSPRTPPEGSPRKSSFKSSPRKSSGDKESISSDLNYINRRDSKSSYKSSPPPNLGTITFPVYVYDCPLAFLMEAIVFKESCGKIRDLYDDQRYRLDEEYIDCRAGDEILRTRKYIDEHHHLQNTHLSPEPVSDDSDTAVYKPNLLLYCKILSLAYSKCFVLTLFKSLHLAYDLHSKDVQAAVDECEETLIDIDITDYLKIVCGHLKDFYLQIKLNKLKQNNVSSPEHAGPTSQVMSMPATASSPGETVVLASTSNPTVGVESSIIDYEKEDNILSKNESMPSQTPVMDGSTVENIFVTDTVQQTLSDVTASDATQDHACSTPTAELNFQSLDNFENIQTKPLSEKESSECLLSPQQKSSLKLTIPGISPDLVSLENEFSQKNRPRSNALIRGENENAKDYSIMDDPDVSFPISLLQLDFPCRTLKPLHRMIKDKFISILMASFKPVPSHQEFYFCAPNWDKIQQEEAITELSKPQVIETEDEVDKLSYLGIAEFRSDHESILGQEAPDETRTSLLSNVDSDCFSDLLEDMSDDVSPLFLHLTCTLRCKDKIGRCSVRVLPTCLRELIQEIELKESELNLNHLQVTLDVLCLTLPPNMECISTEKSLEMKNTSVSSASTSPAEDEANLATSASDSLVSMQQYVDEAVPVDKLKHLPDFQHKAVTTCIEEIQWLMRDEIAAFLLDVFPLQEQTLSLVADHVASSPDRPSCLMEKVPLQFVFGPEQSLEKFLLEFCKLNIGGYRLKQVGSLYYLVKEKQIVNRMKASSLVASVGAKNIYLPHIQDSVELWSDAAQTQIPLSSDENGVLLNYPYPSLDNVGDDDPKQSFTGTPKSAKLHDINEILGPLEDSDSDDASSNTFKWRTQKNAPTGKSCNDPWKGTGVENMPSSLSASLTASPSMSAMGPDGQFRLLSSRDSKSLSALKHSQSCGINAGKKDDSVLSLEPELSPVRWNSVLAWQRKQQGTPAFQSEVSSLVESVQGTEDGYEGDSSDSADDIDLLEDMESCPLLPRFWLIMRIDKDAVTTYFHCRCLESDARDVHRSVVEFIKSTCKVVNQIMLLQSLHDSRICDQLLEPESNDDLWKHPSDNTRDISTSQTKSFDDSMSNEYQGSYPEATTKFRPGWFACSVVWETHFCLHPRLKSGPGKYVFSRGIQALRSVLNRFSVNNRKNMFVYQDDPGNVFYLRLHENFQWITKLTPTGTPGSVGPGRSDNEENSPGAVSRSSSVTSLSASARKISGTNTDDNLLQAQAESRPRIRSFGEKDNIAQNLVDPNSLSSQPYPNRPEGSVVLKVHGISQAGPQVKEELVQVLQNRLDDAVLEVLSIMLARNPMCKLTPEDVHFIQKPHRTPESVIQFSIQPHALSHLQALAYYLRQNLLEFMYTPKYTDGRPEFHFQDYSQPESSKNRVTESDLFLYNQTPASGNRGIACIALAVVDSPGNLVQHSHYPKPASCAYKKPLHVEEFSSLTSVSPYSAENTDAFVEFRIWKRGRVNMDSLTQKLSSAVGHATWDLLTEFCLFTAPLIENEYSENSPTHLKAEDIAELSFEGSYAGAGALEDIHETEVTEVFEIEENNTLHEVYQDTVQPWLKFAVDLGVPAVKRCTVDLRSRHSLAVMLTEIQNLVKTNATDTSAFVFYPTMNEKTNKLVFTLSRDAKMDQTFTDPEENSYCLVIGRNIDQWKACVTDSTNFDQDALFPKAQKVFQKFPPLLAHISGPGNIQFVPRQRFLLASLTNHQITIYTYNWSKDRFENLSIQAKDLGHWLSARSSLLANILMQKLGLFHNLEVVRQKKGTSQVVNPYMSRMIEVDDLLKFSPSTTTLKDPAARRHGLGANSGAMGSGLLISALNDVFRDSKPSRPMRRVSQFSDPVVRNAYQLQDTRQRDKREDQKKLYVMWHTRVATPNIPLAEDVVHLFKQHSRVIHYCLTPLLFLPRWRIQSAATRDHLLSLSSNIDVAPTTDLKTKNSKPPAGNSKIGEVIGIAPAHNPANQVRILHRDSEDEWHHSMCLNFIQEYKQYLQTLGFIPIQTDGHAAHKSARLSGGKVKEILHKEQSESNICYLQKSILGGILLFEISMYEPFFVAKLHALECSRLQSKTSSALVSQFTLSFLDECDKIKILMHLHSFAYDYHLRSISSYVSGRNAILKQGYHLTHFLDDFLKYYSKAPNFARNLVYADAVSVNYVTTPPQQLFNYLLSHEKVYKMEVFRMAPVTNDLDSSEDNEYVLVQLENMPHVTYRDVHDMSHTDDFCVTLVVSYDSASSEKEDTDQSTLYLKYYILLTSTRELFPKLEIGSKLGKFRTVSTASHDPMQLYSLRGLHIINEAHASETENRNCPWTKSVPLCVPQITLTPPAPATLTAAAAAAAAAPNLRASAPHAPTASAPHAPLTPTASAPHAPLAPTTSAPLAPTASASHAPTASAPETPTPETPAPKAPSPEAPQLETPAPEAPTPEAPQLGIPAPETSAPEASAPEAPAPEAPTPETPAPEAPQLGTPTPEAFAPAAPPPKVSAPAFPVPKAPTPVSSAPEAPALPAPISECILSDKQELNLPVLLHHTEIRQESVNYLGYYSSHEQLMHELILERASTARKFIREMVAQGMEHCRTHLLWSKLLTPSRESDRRKDDSFSRDLTTSGLSYSEFCELRSLAVVEPINHLDQRLAPLLCQSLSWYQSLAKVLMSKYADHYRHFLAPDGSVQHVVVLHPRYLEAFMMLSIDVNTNRGDLNAVYSKLLQEKKHSPDQFEFCVADIQSLVEGFVNACSFHLWVSLL